MKTMRPRGDKEAKKLDTQNEKHNRELVNDIILLQSTILHYTTINKVRNRCLLVSITEMLLIIQNFKRILLMLAR